MFDRHPDAIPSANGPGICLAPRPPDSSSPLALKTSAFTSRLRNDLLNETLLWMGIVSMPALAMSLARIPSIGWRPVFALHILLIGLVWLFWILRRHLPYHWRAGVLLLGLGASGIGGYLQLGPVANSGQLLVLFLVAAAIFLNGKAVFRLSLAVTLVLIVIAWAAVGNHLHFQVSYAAYAHESASWGLLVVSFVGYGGAIAALAWRLFDKLTEQELLLAQANADLENRSRQLEEADKVKSEILGTLQHELRTPLNGILGMSELLAMSDLDAEQQSWLACQRESASHLNRLIERMLGYVELLRISALSGTAPINLLELLENISRQYQKKAAAKGLGLTFHHAHDIPALVHADPVRLVQLLSELLENAVRFTAVGSIQVEIRSAGVDQRSNLARIQILVRDSGCGIPVDRHEFILQPLAQIDATTTRETGGIGMGLAIVNQIVNLMQGSLSLASKPGGGSSFKVELPFSVVVLNADI